MSEPSEFQPKIVAYVCNWCTYLGADLAGTNRLTYPANVRIVRLPCTGRIDFNFIVKAFEMGADAVLVSGCHPGDCHYTAGNYHARRRWILFRQLLETLGIEIGRVHFFWISAAEGKKWQQVIAEITEKTREMGPYAAYRQVCQDESPEGKRGQAPFVRSTGHRPEVGRAVPANGAEGKRGQAPFVRSTLRAVPANGACPLFPIDELRNTCRRLLDEGTVRVVIGYGQSSPSGPAYPVFITRPEDVDQLVWNDQCLANLTTYLYRKEVLALGKAAICVKGCDQRALLVLEQESQIDRSEIVVIGLACNGVGNPLRPKCQACDVHAPRGADIVIGQSAIDEPADSAQRRYAAVESFLKKTPQERWAYWTAELARCVKCYACRQVCPLCHCRQCIADKNRPVSISTSATLKGNLAWQITRAFHLAGRCVGCDECTRACPAGIDLRLLNLSLAKAAEENFGYRAGMEPGAELPIGSYSEQDREEFIR